MGVMWFCLGAVFVGILWSLFAWNKKRNIKISIFGWGILLLTLFSLLFTIAWSVSSFIEGEIQAAGAGLLFFGSVTLLLFAIAFRIIKNPE